MKGNLNAGFNQSFMSGEVIINIILICISMHIFSVGGKCRGTNLWLTYSCDAGGIDQTTGNIKVKGFFGIVYFRSYENSIFLEIQIGGW